MSYAQQALASYQAMAGLGSLDAGQSYNIGQQLVAGYNVQSSATAAQKLQAVRDAMAYGFRGSIVNVGWGGPTAPGGVPAGQIFAVVQIAATGITGAAMNSIFANVGANIRTRLPAGSNVANTFASTYGGLVGGASTGLPPATDALTSLLTGGTTPVQQQFEPGIQPLPSDGFFSQTIGGIPMWGVVAGGVVAVGAVAYVVMSGKKTATANRRRARRNRRRHR